MTGDKRIAAFVRHAECAFAFSSNIEEPASHRLINSMINLRRSGNHYPWPDVCSRWGPLSFSGCTWRSRWTEPYTRAAGRPPAPLWARTVWPCWTGGGGFECSQTGCLTSGRLCGWAGLWPAGIGAAARRISPGKHTRFFFNKMQNFLE